VTVVGAATGPELEIVNVEVCPLRMLVGEAETVTAGEPEGVGVGAALGVGVAVGTGVGVGVAVGTGVGVGVAVGAGVGVGVADAEDAR
jgi:hypothetical protein